MELTFLSLILGFCLSLLGWLLVLGLRARGRRRVYGHLLLRNYPGLAEVEGDPLKLLGHFLLTDLQETLCSIVSDIFIFELVVKIDLITWQILLRHYLLNLGAW